MNLTTGFKTKIEKVLLKNLEIKTYVRDHIDPNREKVLKDLVKAGVVLDKMLVIPEYTLDSQDRLFFVTNSVKRFIIDGRHRDLVYDDQGFTEVEVLTIIGGVKTEADLVSLAFLRNNEGALPPTEVDIKHTIEVLLSKKISYKGIAVALRMPEVLCRSYIKSVEDRLKRALPIRTADLMLEKNLTVTEASKITGANPAAVRSHITTQTTRVATKRTKLEKLKRKLSSAYESLNKIVSMNLVSIGKQYDDGDLVAGEVLRLLKDLERHNARTRQLLEEKKSRFLVKLNES